MPSRGERAGWPGLQPRGPASCGGPAVANKKILTVVLHLLYFLLYFAFALTFAVFLMSYS